MEPPAVQYLSAPDGAKIAYGVCGAGPTLIRLPVLWNHFAAQWHPGFFRPEFEALARRFRLVQFDNRGQGLSSRGIPESTTVEDYVGYLTSVIDVSGSERVILMGTSYPSNIAIRYAVECPGRVTALILRDFTDASIHWGHALRNLAEQNWDYFLDTTTRIGFPTKDPLLVRNVLSQAMTQADHVQQSKILQSYSVASILKDIEVPTLVLASKAGTPTRSMSEDSGRFLAENIPGSRLVLVDGPGSMVDAAPGEDPTSMSAIDDFLKGIEPSGTDRLPVGLREVTSMAVRHLNPLPLSGRQMEVLRLIAEGKSNKEIAEVLVLSLRTVERHITDLYTRLDVRNRSEATAFVMNTLNRD